MRTLIVCLALAASALAKKPAPEPASGGERVRIVVPTSSERWGGTSVSLVASAGREGWRSWAVFEQSAWGDDRYPSSTESSCTVDEPVAGEALEALEALIAYVPTEHEQRGGSGPVLVEIERGGTLRTRISCTIDASDADADTLCGRVQAWVTVWIGGACEPGACGATLPPAPAQPGQVTSMPTPRLAARFEARTREIRRRECPGS